MFGLLGALNRDAFSSQPLSFLDRAESDDLSTCLQIHLLENGSRVARDEWQKKQLTNLLNYAYANSKYWRTRLPSPLPDNCVLDFLPILTRDDVNFQVKTEGALVQREALGGVSSYASSGSTGVPVKVFSMPQNARYNEIRSIAQYFIEQRSLNLNRTFIKPADGMQVAGESILDVDIFDSWTGSIGKVFQHGDYKIINFRGDIEPLIAELSRSSVGYLACLGSHMDLLIKAGGEALIKKLDIKMWLHHSDNLDLNMKADLERWGVSVRSSYSCSEIGPLAVECVSNPGFYHAAHSNVILEKNLESYVVVNGETIYGLLATHLHSYATPLIRYDVGDFGKVHSQCPCGHEGSTISNIFGRRKFFLRRADGELIPFFIFSKPLLDILSFQEFFVYQPDRESLIVELGGAIGNSASQVENLKEYVSNLTGNAFQVYVNLVEKIDWSKNPKRIPFICYV